MVFLSVLAVLALLVSAEGSVGPSTNSSFCTESKECLEYELVCRTDEYEVRRYSPTRWVSTDAEAYFMGVGAAMAFRRLFQFINGANEGGIQMDMTAPILVKIPEETKMWEPAVYTLNFPLPAAYQDKPPAPTNDKLYFTEMPEMDVYVRSYGGWMLSVTSRLHAHLLTKELARVRASYNHSYHYGVGYDSPLKLLNRHNEVWYVSEGEPVCSDPREPTPAHTARPTPTELTTDASPVSWTDAAGPSGSQADVASGLQADATSDLQADAPSDPQADALSDPQADAPSDPQADAPSDLQTDAPSEPEADAPSEPQANAPSDPEADAPSEPQADAPSEPLALALSDTPSAPPSNLSSNTTFISSSQSPSNAPTPAATSSAPPGPSSGPTSDAAVSHPPTSPQIPAELPSSSTHPPSLSPSLEPRPDAARWNTTPHGPVDTHAGGPPAAEPEGTH